MLCHRIDPREDSFDHSSPNNDSIYKTFHERPSNRIATANNEGNDVWSHPNTLGD